MTPPGGGRLRVGLIQANSGIGPAANAERLARAAHALADDGARLLFTPEMSGLLDRDPARLRAAVRPEAEDATLAALARVAAERRVHIHLGSVAALLPDGRIANRGLLIDDAGEIRARYDKLHLFDVDLPTGERHRESATYAPGERAVAAATPHATLGLAICYDLRFPALFNALANAGATILSVPAAFTVPTGRAHWHVLLRARAIETGSFVVAAAQAGRHEDGRETYGHSLVVDPWGEVLLDMGGTPWSHAAATLDLAAAADARTRIPALRHARPIPPISPA